MKFWELISVFRQEKELLTQILNQKKWKEYLDNYLRVDQLITGQDRNILDGDIPDELVIEVCSKSRIKFWFYPEMEPPRLYSYKAGNNDLIEELTMKETFLRFGGHNLEQALEKSYTEIPGK